MNKFIFLFTLILISQNSLSQTWQELVIESSNHNNNEEYHEAIDKGMNALSLFRQADESENNNFAALLSVLVTAHYGAEEYEKAIEYGLMEKKVRESLSLTNDLNYSYALFNIASSFMMNNNPSEAIPLFQSSLTLNIKLQGSNSDDALLSEWKLASCYMYIEEEEKSLTHFENAFRHLSDDTEIDFNYVQAALDYTILLSEKQNYSKALPYLEQLRNIYEDNDLVSQPEYALILRNLSVAYFSEGDERASDIFEAGILSYKEKYPNDQLLSEFNSWSVELQQVGQPHFAQKLLAENTEDNNAYSFNNLAALAFQERNYLKAVDYYVEALGLLNKTEPDQALQYADISENLVVLLLTIGETDKAFDYQKMALELYSKHNAKKQKVAAAKVSLAEIYMTGTDYELAGRFFDEALKGLGQSDPVFPRAISGLAIFQHKKGNYQEADSLYRKALALSENGNKRIYADVLNNYGSFLEENRNYLSARRYLEEALEIEKLLYGENSVQYSKTLRNLSTLFLETGEYSQAKIYAALSANITKELFGEKNIVYSSSLIDYGRVLTAMGYYKEAEPLLLKALNIRESILGKKDLQYADALNISAYFYQTLGNFDEAEPMFKEAIEIYANTIGKQTIQYSTALENLGTLYQLTAEPEKALPLLSEVLEIDRVILGEEHPLFSTTLHNLASLYKELQQYEKSESLFRQAIEIEKNTFGTQHPTYANTLFNLASLYQDMEKYEDAERIYREVLKIREKVLGENHPDYAQALYGMASINRVLKKPEATDYYYKTLDQYLYQITEYFPALSEKEKSAFYEKIKPSFESFNDFAIEQALLGNSAVLNKMYDVQLATKALLLSSSTKVRERILSGNDENLKNTFNQWIELKEKIVKYFNLSVDELESEGVNLSELVAQANELEKEISARSELFASEIDNNEVSWRSVKESLPEKGAALEIFRIEKQFVDDSVFYAALVLHNHSASPELIVFPNGNQLETRLFNYYRNAIRFTVGDEISYKNFWTPIASSLSGAEIVYISPDGIYNKLNINTLFDPIGQKYVIDEYDVRYLSNTRELVESESHEVNNTNTSFIFGNPDFGGTLSELPAQTRASMYGFSANGVPGLPGTETELNDLTSELQKSGWQYEVFDGKRATEDNFKTIESPKLVHIATHGFFMPDLKVEEGSKAFGIHIQNEIANPLFRSGILLAGVNNTLLGNRKYLEEDGIVSAYEAMTLNLDKTELVVLSACETGLGEVKNGEGVYGLQRSFLVAGAQSLIMSLWKVNDETTQQLMSLFYKSWLTGTDKFDAFYQAQKELKKLYPDPYHWGAFIILGK